MARKGPANNPKTTESGGLDAPKNNLSSHAPVCHLAWSMAWARPLALTHAMAQTLTPAMALAMALVLLGGCLPILSGGPRVPSGFTAPTDRFLIGGVPFIPDDSSHGGPSSLASVMTFQGRETSMGEVAVDVQRTDLRGALGPDMVIWAREKGMEASFAAAKPQELIDSIKNRKPAIVLLGGGLGPIRKGHFAVALGYAPEGLVVNSGLVQQEILPWKDFFAQWRKMGNFTIFVNGLAPGGPLPEGQGPASGQGAGKATEPAKGQGPVVPEGVEVVSPARASQVLDLPEGIDVPEEINEVRPAPTYVLPGQRVPDFLTGAALPASSTTEAPIVDLTGQAPPPEERDIQTDSDKALGGSLAEAGPGGPGKGKPGLTLAMEPLPLPDGGSGKGFNETDVGLPLMLPVVPLPEEQPISGTLMGSDFKGPATVPGAKTPNQSPPPPQGQPEAKNAAAQPASESVQQTQPAESAPVMEWER